MRARFLEAFRQGLRELGYVEGQNIAIESRSWEDKDVFGTGALDDSNVCHACLHWSPKRYRTVSKSCSAFSRQDHMYICAALGSDVTLHEQVIRHGEPGA
jgi:hypothetical protein